MKTICPPGNHHNGFVATHTLGHMMCPSAWVTTCNNKLHVINFVCFIHAYLNAHI